MRERTLAFKENNNNNTETIIHLLELKLKAPFLQVSRAETISRI